MTRSRAEGGPVDEAVRGQSVDTTERAPTGPWTAAGWLSIGFGSLTTIALAMTLASLVSTGAPPVVFGIRWTGDGPLESAGMQAWRASVGLAIVASLLDIVIGQALLRGRRGGMVGAVAKLPLDLGLAVGFGAPPVPMLVYPARIVLIAAGRRPGGAGAR